MLVSDFAEDSLEDCWYHAAAFEISGEKIVDAHGEWENWDAFASFLENEEMGPPADELYSEETSGDYYLEIGGHGQTYTTAAEVEEDARKFLEGLGRG